MTTASAVRYRDATADDLPALVALDAVCFPPETRYPLELMRFFVLQRKSKTIAAVSAATEIIAFINVHLRRNGIGEVVTIDVSPAARRQHIGEELMRQGEEWLRGLGARGIFLEVDEDNRAALALYEKLGYERRHGFLEDGKPRLLMEKPL